MGPGRLLRPRLRRHRPRPTASAAATSARWRPSTRWRTASRRSAVGGEPDQWLALQVAPRRARRRRRDRAATTRCASAPRSCSARAPTSTAATRSPSSAGSWSARRSTHPAPASRVHRGRARGAAARAEGASCRRSDADTVPGLIPNIIVGRIANRLDLHGADLHRRRRVRVLAGRRPAGGRATCSTGDCDLALAGGSQVWMPVPTLILFCRLGALSRREQMRPFDADADGTLLGEGIGMVVLKRAGRRGARRRPRLRGRSAASASPATAAASSVMAPRVEGEELALRRAYERGRASRRRSVGLIEAHGTGTPVGDVAEIQALTPRLRRARRRAGPLRDRLGQVDDQPHDPGRRRRGADQDRAGAAPPRAAADAALRRAEPEARAGAHAVLHQHRDAAVDPRRPRAAPGGRQRVRLRRHQRPRGAGGVRRRRRVADHRPPWETELCVLESATAEGLADEAERLAAALGAAARRSP